MSIMNTRMLAAFLAASTLVPAVGRADDLAAKVATKLKDSGTMSGYRVAVRSEERTIFLEGSVGNPKQIEMAVITAENTPGVERVVNRLSVSQQSQNKSETSPAEASGNQPIGLSLPSSMKSIFGTSASAARAAKPKQDPFRLAQATEPSDAGEAPQPRAVYPEAVSAKEPPAAKSAASARSPSKPAVASKGSKPAPLGTATGRPIAQQPTRRTSRGSIARTSGVEGQPPMIVSDVVVGEGLPGPQHGVVGDGQIVPGSERIVNDSGAGIMAGGRPGMGSGGYAGGVSGRPLPMGAGGSRMPIVSTSSGEGPNMPNYAWPSYAASPNYAAIQYPTQYSPTAWPYIGPFYPYPQVPLGWRRVSLEWDDGWWFLDFDDDHHRRGHHRY